MSLQLFIEFQNKRRVYEKDYAIDKIKISLVKCHREHSYTTGVALNE